MKNSKLTLFFFIAFVAVIYVIATYAGNHGSSVGIKTTTDIVRGADYATLKIEVDATLTDEVRRLMTNQVIDSVITAEGDLVRNRKPEVCADYQSQWTTIMVELDYK